MQLCFSEKQKHDQHAFLVLSIRRKQGIKRRPWRDRAWHTGNRKARAPDDFLDQLFGVRPIETVGQAIDQEPMAADQSFGSSRRRSGRIQPLPCRQGFDARHRGRRVWYQVIFFTLTLERAGNLADLRELVGTARDATATGSVAGEACELTENPNNMLRYY